MSYTSAYSGQIIDDSVAANEVQNNEIDTLKKHIQDLNSTIATLTKYIDDELLTIQSTLSNLERSIANIPISDIQIKALTRSEYNATTTKKEGNA